MTDIEHTPGPWDYDMDYILAPDPNGRFPEIYIAEIAHIDDEGRIASPEQQDANRHLIAAAPAMLASLRAVLPYAENESRSLAECWKRDGEPAAEVEAKACELAIAAAQAAIALTNIDGPPWKIDARPAGNQPYSVLLLYPDFACMQHGTETYYAFVEASDPIDAVAVAQRQAVAAQEVEIDDPTDFLPLLVTQGHHYGHPLFNL